MIENYQHLQDGIEKGLIDEDEKIRKICVRDLPEEFRDVKISLVERQEELPKKYAKSMIDGIFRMEQNKEEEIRCLGGRVEITRISIAIRDKQRYIVDGLRNCTAIWWAMGWNPKKKSWLTEEEQKALGDCEIMIIEWQVKNIEGEHALWLYTHDLIPS